MKKLKRVPVVLLLVLAVTLGLSGCVTTTNQRIIDHDAALDKRIQLGMKYLSVDKRDNARFQFSKALELDKNSARAYHGIALVHQANGEAGPALDNFNKALKLSDAKAKSNILVSYGKYWMAQKQPEKACEHFEVAANDYDFTRRPEALYFAGICARVTGNHIRVKPAFEHALNLNEAYAPVMIELAEMYFTEGSYSKSKPLLDKYITLVTPTARSLWLGIRIERIFENKDKEASYGLALKNRHPYSQEYLEYKNLLMNK